MQNNMKRQNIRCWKCKELFSLLIDISGEPTLTLTCPYDGAPLTINLSANPRKDIIVMRQADKTDSMVITVYDLPEILESTDPSINQ